MRAVPFFKRRFLLWLIAALLWTQWYEQFHLRCLMSIEMPFGGAAMRFSYRFPDRTSSQIERGDKDEFSATSECHECYEIHECMCECRSYVLSPRPTTSYHMMISKARAFGILRSMSRVRGRRKLKGRLSKTTSMPVKILMG